MAIRRSLVGMRGVPCHPMDIGAADADVGQLAVAEARQFAQALVVALPLTDETDKVGKHSGALSFVVGLRR